MSLCLWRKVKSSDKNQLPSSPRRSVTAGQSDSRLTRQQTLAKHKQEAEEDDFIKEKQVEKRAFESIESTLDVVTLAKEIDNLRFLVDSLLKKSHVSLVPLYCLLKPLNAKSRASDSKDESAKEKEKAKSKSKDKVDRVYPVTKVDSPDSGEDKTFAQLNSPAKTGSKILSGKPGEKEDKGLYGSLKLDHYLPSSPDILEALNSLQAIWPMYNKARTRRNSSPISPGPLGEDCEDLNPVHHRGDGITEKAGGGNIFDGLLVKTFFDHEGKLKESAKSREIQAKILEVTLKGMNFDFAEFGQKLEFVDKDEEQKNPGVEGENVKELKMDQDQDWDIKPAESPKKYSSDKPLLSPREDSQVEMTPATNHPHALLSQEQKSPTHTFSPLGSPPQPAILTNKTQLARNSLSMSKPLTPGPNPAPNPMLKIKKIQVVQNKIPPPPHEMAPLQDESKKSQIIHK